ncbi:MAG: SGNH/GDSL hydrolase family protein [Lentisphaerae bacterium]|nr:SGNH/GDSL hydrolase family protein [Lentisphaerota bacterium]
MITNPAPALFLAAAVSVRAAGILADGSHVAVEAGPHPAGGRTVTVAAAVRLPVAPAPVLAVTNETVLLSGDAPAGWSKGARLKALSARDVNASGAFVPGSLEIRRAAGGEALRVGEDVLVDEVWGHVGVGPSGRAATNEAALAGYRYSLRRMDTIQVSADGVATLKAGEPHISAPAPPPADPGCAAIAHVFVDHRGAAVAQGNIYPILESPAQAVTGTTRGRIPRTLAKLRAGGAVTIVCCGDSVTAGGNASKPELGYVDVFAAGLRERFPKAALTVTNLSAGGSNSRQWLYPDRFPYRGRPAAETGVDFQRVLDAKPDLVTIEFVNDCGLSPAQVEEGYGDLLGRVRGVGAELILITPHFTMPKMMNFANERGVEARPYVLTLRAFAERNGLAVADASARWEHLWKEGLPYTTLLHNTINHPDDRGHRLFAEELWKCFEGP